MTVSTLNPEKPRISSSESSELTNGWDRVDSLVELQLVENRRLAGTVQSEHQGAAFDIREHVGDDFRDN